MRRFFSVHDVPDVELLTQQALSIKQSPFLYEYLGRHKTLGLVFFNSSLRTRISTQKAAHNLGMNVMVMNVGTETWKLEFGDGAIMNLDTVEHVKEGAAVLGQYCDVLGVRAFAGLQDKHADYAEEVFHKIEQYSGVPVVSLESATRHPLQSLADLMTIRELQTNTRPKVVLSWAPHPKALPQAVPNSFAEWMLRSDVELVITHPQGYELAPEFTKGATVLHDQADALHNADFVYPKNWSSYTEYGKVLHQDSSWMFTAEKLRLTNNAKVMHCLPTRRNVEIADDVLDSASSVVIHEAANRVWAAQAVLYKILEQIFES